MYSDPTNPLWWFLIAIIACLFLIVSFVVLSINIKLKNRIHRFFNLKAPNICNLQVGDFVCFGDSPNIFGDEGTILKVHKYMVDFQSSLHKTSVRRSIENIARVVPKKEMFNTQCQEMGKTMDRI